MKLFAKMSLTAMMIGTVVVSCQQENNINPQRQIQNLTDIVISSSKFENLNISASVLRLSNSQFVSVKKNALVIPFEGRDDRKGLIALFNEKYEIQSVVIFEALTDIPSDLIPESIKSGHFKGAFVFESEDGRVQLNIENSKIISNDIKRKLNARASSQDPEESVLKPKCNDITKPGGAYDCAGARITQMNWWDATFCYVSFVPCFAQTVISCMLDGCTTSQYK